MSANLDKDFSAKTNLFTREHRSLVWVDQFVWWSMCSPKNLVDETVSIVSFSYWIVRVGVYVAGNALF